MSSRRCVIDGMYFTSPEAYEAALRDKELINTIVGNMNLDNADDVRKIYQKLNKENYRFESQLGIDFDNKIFDLYKNGVPSKSEVQKKSIGLALWQVVKIFNSQNTSKNDSTVSFDDYDEKMQKEIVLQMDIRRTRRKAIGLMCGLMAITCFGYISFYSKATDISKAEFEELQALKEESRTVVTNTNVEKTVKVHLIEGKEIVIPDILQEYRLLYEKNEDLIGWIKIDDTVIDYPVMQSKDNEFYLNRNFKKENDKNGSIFLDKDCDVLSMNDNLILYGHHMRSGNMFGTLSKYKSKDYMEKHPRITFDTIYEHGTYEIMYVFQSKVLSEVDVSFKYYQFINASSQAEFYSAMNEMAKLSLYDTGVSATYGDKLLTLSTCDYQENKGRLVVVARKV